MTESFDPLSFLTLGRQLAQQSGGEAHLRTAVGRAYYALYLYTRLKVLKKAYASHRKVFTLARQKDKQEGTAVADKLNDLYDLRKLADYHFEPVPYSDWKHVWSRARSIVDHILPQMQSW